MRGRNTDETPSNRRFTVPQAAAALGITEGAVRGRVKRGTLPSQREGGTVYVILGEAELGDQSASSRDETSGPRSDQTQLIEVLREQLQAERQAHAEARRIIAGLVERLPPQLEAPSEKRDAPETVEQEPERGQPRPDAPGPSEAEGTRRPWWRRVFGG